MKPSAFLIAASVFSPALVGAEGLSPAAALARMKPAAGFQVELVASEPEIRQPVTMSFDSRGRLWVIQYLQYPNPAGLKAVHSDRYLRTTYDRIPDPPPKGPLGADRITICEDADRDGRMDVFKDFATGLNLASGMALAPDGVYVLQAPYLLFYPDRDADDRPDGPPEPVLEGFGMEDAHAVGNSLIWGPDGWLYGAQGSTVTAKIRGIEFQQGIWRFHPATKRFELFAEGGGNIWGLDFDGSGNLFAGTNWGGYAMMHVVQGGYYIKGFEKHGPLHNPYAFGYFDHVPYKDFRGGHVTCGGVIYRGGVFPKEFDGAYIAANLLSNAIHWHRLTPDRSTFQAEFGGELLTTDDPCFRPIDCLVGPDGNLYVADWYDKRANHVDPVDDWDKSTGRIYRIKPNLPQASTPIRLNPTGGINAADAAMPAAIRRPSADEILRSSYDHPASSLFAATPAQRSAAVRAIGDDPRWLAEQPKLVAELRRLADGEKDAKVRCQLAATARRLESTQAIPLLAALIQHDEDADDPFIPLMIWWALESKLAEDRGAAATLFKDPSQWSRPLVRRHLVERTARRLAAAGNEADWRNCRELFKLAPSESDRALVWEGIDAGISGRSFSTPPTALVADFHRDLSRNPASRSMLRLALRFQLPGAVERQAAKIADPGVSDAEKIAAIAALAEDGRAAALDELAKALDLRLNDAVRLRLIQALERSTDSQIALRLVREYEAGSPKIKSQAIQSLLARPAWASILLDAIDEAKTPVSAIDDAGLQKLASFKDEALSARVAKRWGKIRPPSPGEVRARIHGVMVTLRMAKGSPERGAALFKEHCAICHKLFGDGNAVGPELTGLDRNNLEFLVSSVVDPSAIIRKEYSASIVSTMDGRVLTGLIAEQTADAVVLLDARNERVTIARSEIEAIRPSEQSLMPDKLLDKLDHGQLRDLFAYLQSAGPRRQAAAADGAKAGQ